MNKQFQIYSVDFNAFYNDDELNINKRKYEIYNKMHDYENYYDILAKCNLNESNLSFENYIKLKDTDDILEYKNIQRKEYYKFIYSLRGLSSNERKKELKFKQIRDNKTKKSMAMNNETYKKLILEKKYIKNELNNKINSYDKNSIRELNKEFLIDRNIISLFDNSLRRLLNEKINEVTLDIICVTITHYNMMEQLINNGFILNNEKYIMFTASAGQIRNKKVLFIKEDLWKKNEQAIMCGLTIDKINSKGGMNINKFLAYLSLQNSATETLEGFDIDKSIVVEDLETTLNNRMVQYIEKYKNESDDRLYIKKPIKKEVDIPISHTDGFGMHMFKGNKKSFQIRLPFMKGLMGYCDWKMFISETKGASPVVKDIWGKEHNVLNEDIEFIFTKSQFKMWKYYESWEEYKKYFKQFNNEAGYCNEEENKNEFKKGRFNYQYWQSLVDVKEDEIKVFTDPIVNKINNCHDNIKTMLDVFGANSSNKNMSPEQKLLYKYPPLLKDSHFKDSLSDKISMIKKNAKSGKFEINSINSFLIPDVYALMEYLFCGIEKPKGILQDGEVSCKYFNDDKLLLERSPHLYREHAVRNNINYYNCKDEKTKELMEKYFISNGVYVSNHDLISKILQCDYDGDHALITNDKTLISCAERNCKDILPLYYDMGKADSIEINNSNICISLQNAFKYGNIGIYSNKVTNIWNDSHYKEEIHLPLIMLLTAMNNYSIDSAKTLEMVDFSPELKIEYSELLKKANGCMPYFFQFAKDKDKTMVCEKIDYSEEGSKISTVNMICEEIEKCNNSYKYDMSKVGTLNITALLSENTRLKDIDLDSEINKAFIEKYEEIDLNKNKKIISLKDKDSEQFLKNVFNAYNLAKKDLFDYMNSNNIDKIKGVDMLIKYLFKVKINCKKTLLFNCFEDIILNNLQNNLKDKDYSYCENCGEKFNSKSKTNKSKYCELCAKEKQRISKLEYKKRLNKNNLIKNI